MTRRKGEIVGGHQKGYHAPLFLSTSAAVGATKLLGGTEWPAAIGILAFIFVLMEIDGRMSARSIFLVVPGWRTGKNCAFGHRETYASRARRGSEERWRSDDLSVFMVLRRLPISSIALPTAGTVVDSGIGIDAAIVNGASALTSPLMNLPGVRTLTFARGEFQFCSRRHRVEM